MVFYSQQADDDLDSILDGMLKWEKFELTFEFVSDYINDIINVCNDLDSKPYHANTKFSTHKKYGEKVYNYRRNQRTTIFIVYDLDQHKNVYINKIMSNHTTKVRPYY